LDEIGEVPVSVQVKLLRVLESRTFFRVGGTQPIRVDVRVIAATNRALKERVAAGEFRDDLFYRLNVLNIYLPPLRERREDIPLLVRRFIREFSQLHDRQFRGITTEAMQRLVAAPWPGNVRQLRNLIESMVVLAPGTEIRASDIPEDIFEGAPTVLPVPVVPRGREQTEEFQAALAQAQQQWAFVLRSLMDLRLQVEELRRRLDDRGAQVQVIEVAEPQVSAYAEGESAVQNVVYRPGMTMAEVEKAAIEAVLRQSKGNRRMAAQALGIGERTLYRKLKEYSLGQ
jgi:DNA-binding NtrC family response regulator